MHRLRPALTAVVSAMVVGLLVPATSSATSLKAPSPSTSASTSAPSKGGPSKGTSAEDCLWFGPTFTTDDSELNYAFPDSGANYWAAHFSIPDGATLRLEHEYAHARYQSLNSYDITDRTPVDALNDVATRPDAGSRNPYLPGARRAGDAHRDYTVTVDPGQLPADGGEPNTLYAGVPGQDTQMVLYRLYLPDKNRDRTGGAGLPEPVLTLADGQELRGAEACEALESDPKTPSLSLLPMDKYQALREQPGRPSTFPADQDVSWHTYYNSQYFFECLYLSRCDSEPARTGGQYSNIDNQYVTAFVNRQFGEVLVLRGRLPKTPATLGRAPFAADDAQMRYWSLCSNEASATTRAQDCVFDEQVPTDEDGWYTIVVSRAEDRPANADARCGVAWLEWPERGDGAGHLDDGLLLLRNMLPSPDFGQAVQDTRSPGDEREVMGDYLPTSTYTSQDQFEQEGCQG